MSATSQIVQRSIGLIRSIGKSALSALYPNDFEVYICSLELVNSKGDTIDFFTFPISPESISKTEPKKTQIRQTAGGTTVLTSTVYVPEEINIRGNFGRNFKILLSLGTSLSGAAFSLSAGKYALSQIMGKNTSALKTPPFDLGIKSGFGCIRMLKGIISKSNGVDENGLPFNLYFYNLAFGESYLVTIPPSGITFSQNMAKNMIWEYNLNMTAIAPLEAVIGTTAAKSSIRKLLAADAIQKGISAVADTVSNIIKS